MKKNRYVHIFLVCMALIIIFTANKGNEPDEANQQLANKVAAEFLQLVDSEQYGRSWAVSAQVLRERISQELWNKEVAHTRLVFGPLVERKLDMIEAVSSMPDIPDGEFIVMIYKGKFQVRAEATETLTLMREADNAWRVAGYFLQ